MPIMTRPVTPATLKRAIETGDGRTLASFYASHAMARIIDRDHPPSKPREIKGRAEIATYWDEVCSRSSTHYVNMSIAEGNRLAFTQACAYRDGTKVFSMAMLELENGRIVSQTIVQAWDE
jgi:hypothetical protein